MLRAIYGFVLGVLTLWMIIELREIGVPFTLILGMSVVSAMLGALMTLSYVTEEDRR